MHKIDEREDLSRKVLEVDIDSPVFSSMLDKLNEQIIEVIKKVYNEKFESGDVSLKLTITVPRMRKKYELEDECGQPLVQSYEYKALQFKHNVTTTLKKVNKEEGSYWGEKELKEDGSGNFIEAPIKDPQISMFED